MPFCSRHPVLCSLVLLTALVLAAACAVNPATGKRQLSLVGEGQEIAMGREADGEIGAQMGLYEDDALLAVVSATGQRLARLSERPDLPWSFKIVDDPAVNAFALPGGYIYVTRGILAHFNSEAELAGVLGHEIGHVTARHSVNQMSKAQLAGIGLGLGSVLEPSVARYADLTSAGMGLLFLKFGRDDERQADDLSVRYMTRAGYPPEALVDVFRMLEATSGAADGARVPGWLSTHPSPENREARIREQAAVDGGAPAPVDTTWLRRLEGLIYGADPRQGFFRDQLFLHPDMNFQILFPGGWTAANERAYVAARPENGDALIKLTLAAEAGAAAAADAFFGRSGIRRGPAWRSDLNGLTAVSATFQVGEPGADDTVAGLAAFVEVDGTVLRLLGYAPIDAWGARRGAVETSFASFRRLAAARDRDVQPRRLTVTRVNESTTLAAFHRRYPSTVGLDEIAVLNRLQPDSVVTTGTLIKRVVGGP